MGKRVNHSLGRGGGIFFLNFLIFLVFFWHIVKLASKQVSKEKKKTINTYLHTQRGKKCF